jgi:hypothetical protein
MQPPLTPLVPHRRKTPDTIVLFRQEREGQIRALRAVVAQLEAVAAMLTSNRFAKSRIAFAVANTKEALDHAETELARHLRMLSRGSS